MLALLNYSETASTIKLDTITSSLTIELNNYPDVSIDNHKITLKPYQAVIIAVE